MTDETKAMLVQYSVLVWQSFIRTSHLLSSKLAGVILDKPFAVVHTGRDYPGQATLASRNPARTNQFLETLNWHVIWYRPRSTTCQFLITAGSVQIRMRDSDLTSNLLWRRNKSVSSSWSLPEVSAMPNVRQRFTTTFYLNKSHSIWIRFRFCIANFVVNCQLII